ncbi:carbohydrate-selective porin [Terriglobus roseus DSM 18391]|uniref:Carbohydrate-selective porin n=1 Tax=Terriglobus roseus (strain DSM 18391 / NRRL B-41598 / KBS 63) TaxID=926566 RepID=I3ZLL5_TERRK|nr:carbohydrate porin [Terriglobus roseus]AFL90133.1 carbohydrate-selective porin [Terriglobus roseus DSM 18391]
MDFRSSLLGVVFLFGLSAAAQVPAGPQPSATTPAADASATQTAAPTMFPHSETRPWYIAGQANSILQGHGAFHSPYEGLNSLVSRGEYKVSLVGTLFLGLQPWQLLEGGESTKALRYNTDLILHVEATGGRGISQALGLAGFTNLDVVRNPNLGSKPYIARVMVHQTIGFTDEMTDNTRGPLALATKVPVRRLEVRVGKMSTPDVFDINSVLSDSHLQFTNWSIDNNGAWDYAADTRGYSYGATLDYQDRNWAVRYALMLMPTVANGIDLDWAVKRSRGQNMEFELRRGFLPGKKGTHRVLAFVNNANMGSYREAITAFRNGADATPDISLHRHPDSVKYGFGYNMEQAVTDHLTVAGRVGWNDGKTESFAYTEIEQSALAGASYDGKQWGRADDKLGLAFSSNAIKRYHQQYLASGGAGFILGDGNLRYGRENIVEGYYNLHVWRGSYFATGVSHINNPGYNRDRGPVWVPSLRAHMDF